MEIYQVPPYPTGKPETKILPSVRGCEGVSSVSGDDVPDQGKEFIRNTTTVVTPVHLYIEGPPNPPSAPGGGPHRTPTLLLGPHHVFTPSHWNCPSTTLSSRSFSDGRAIQKTSFRKARVSSAGW
jgi:hypothetical protein